MRFQCYLRFGLEIEPFLLILGCVFPLVSRFSLLSSFFWIRILRDFFPSSSQPSCSVIVLSLLPMVTNLALELQRTRFDDEDSVTSLWELLQSSLNLGWILILKPRVHAFVLELFMNLMVLICNCQERESEICFVEMARVNLILWHCVQFIACHVCCGPMSSCHVVLELLGWLFGPICNYVKIWTVLQFWKVLRTEMQK